MTEPVNVTVVKKEAEAKPGIKTSEFWLSMLTNIMCLAVLIFVMMAEKNPNAPAWLDSVLLILPLLLSTMQNMGYGNQRIKAKADAALARYAARKDGGNTDGPDIGTGTPPAPGAPGVTPPPPGS